MENRFDISTFVNVETQQMILYKLVEREKKRRKEAGLSRKELSYKSGVSYSSIRRFEETGEISLDSLMKIAQTLDSLSDFNNLFCHRIVTDLKNFKG